MTYRENERLAAVEVKVDSIQDDIREIKEALGPVSKYIISDESANVASAKYASSSRKYIVAAVTIASAVVTITIAVLTFALHLAK